ncbi:GrpB domain, predicted nucleotidyltransferase, UPF0157 family [Rhizobiales bacterium GAS191]|nr:GrpB domain, predicted nucleotidyltransferase, UPF0157 family [Rhizobiales bacterium GAS191]
MDEIEIVEYDPRWPALFAEEVALLRAALDRDLVVGLEHFGSTAIPGMAAKPIIDILVAVRSLAEARVTAIRPLQRLGYMFWAENPKTDRMFFVKGLPPYGARRTHHVHITETTGEPWLNLPFRDYLRAHPDEARRYERLKRDLAIQHHTDREAYTDAKADFLEEILSKARQESA